MTPTVTPPATPLAEVTPSQTAEHNAAGRGEAGADADRHAAGGAARRDDAAANAERDAAGRG